MGKFYVTTAIVYVNDKPALHYLYEVVAADVLARYHRMIGDDTFFLTGTDEHSINVERAAKREGLPAKVYSDQMAQRYRDVEAQFGISYDRFIRTEDSDHVAGVQKFIGQMQAKGDIYKGTYSGWYCPSCEAFYQADELNDGYCRIHPSIKASWLQEDNYFFALSKYQDRLLQHIEKHPEFIQPESRRNEILGWLKAGLRDFSISRSTITWGIPFPGDERHVVYVWGDALVKDITRFHALYWPAMLMSAGVALPKRIWGHGFMLYRGQRTSKTAGTAIDPIEVASMFGADAVRYLVLREVPFDRDADISVEAMTDRFNADLANDLGNFVYRSLSMLQRYFDGKVPAP